MSQGTDPMPMSTPEFTAYIAQDRAQWQELANATGLRAD
jgi:tripartite-type tricarboxylate transporter receptor subunit TctC